MSEGASIEVLQAVLDAFNDHDLDRIMGFFADECVLEMPRGPPFGSRFVRKHEVRHGLAGRFKGLPYVRYDNPIHSQKGSGSC